MDEQVSAQNPQVPQPASNTLLKILILFGIFFLIAGSAYVGYWYGKSQTSKVEPEPKVVTNQPSTTPSNSGVGETGKSDSTLGWEVYNSNEFGFSVDYPKGVKITELPPYVSGTGAGTVTSVSCGNCDFYIFMYDNKTTLGLVDWLKETPGVLPESRQAKVPSEEKYTIAGEKALLMCALDDSSKVVSWTVYLQRGQKVFSLWYNTPQNTLDFEQFRHFLSSFEFDDTARIADILPQQSDCK